jgi:hypothetical protein
VQGFFKPKEKAMFKHTLSIALIFTLLFGYAAVPSVAAKSKAEKAAEHAAKVKAQITQFGTGPDARLSVKLRDKTKLSGYVSQANADSFVITDPKTGVSTEVPYPNVVQAKGKNLSTGAIIAISAAIAVGATLLVLFILAATLGD